MRRVLTILILFIIISSCNYSFEKKDQQSSHKQSKIIHYSTSNFDSLEYQKFIKNLVEFELKCNWIYIHPVQIKKTITTNQEESDLGIYTLPPSPPSIQCFKDDSLSFTANLFDSTIIFNDEIFKKANGDSLFEYYGTGIIVSLPYSSENSNELFIDYEIVNWGWCGTGKYQTINYEPKQSVLE